MEKNSNNQSLEDLFDVLKEKVENTNEKENLGDILDGMNSKIKEINKIRYISKKIALVLLLSLTASLISNFLMFDRTGKLESEMGDRLWKDSLFNAIMQSDNKIRYLTINGTVVTYNQLANENDSLIKVHYDEKSHNSKLQLQLDLIKRNYPIEIKREGDVYTVVSPQIDSALILLPYYRDKLKYNHKDKSWSITVKK